MGKERTIWKWQRERELYLLFLYCPPQSLLFEHPPTTPRRSVSNRPSVHKKVSPPPPFPHTILYMHKYNADTSKRSTKGQEERKKTRVLCWSTYLLFLRRELSLGPGFPLKSIEIFGVINLEIKRADIWRSTVNEFSNVGNHKGASFTVYLYKDQQLW